MPNVALIKASGMPLNIPASSVYGIFRTPSVKLEALDTRTILLTTYKNNTSFWIVDSADDVFEAVQNNLPKNAPKQFWAKLEPVKLPEDESWAKEHYKIQREVNPENLPSFEEYLKALEELRAVKDSSYVLANNLIGYDGVKQEDGTLALQYWVRDANGLEISDLCAYTPENEKELQEAIAKSNN